MVSSQKLISCILPKGVAHGVLSSLRSELGVITAHINNARGVGKITPLAHRGLGGQSEKEILTVIVDDERADEVFEFIYVAAEVNRPHGGLMVQVPLQRATSFELPDLPAES